MNKRILLITFLTLIIVFTAACNVLNEDANKDNNSIIEPDSLADNASDKAADDSSDSDRLVAETVEYVGQIDANSIEVKLINTVSEEDSFKSFRLSEQIKENFEFLNVEEGEIITINYKEDENGNNVIYGIVKKGKDK